MANQVNKKFVLILAGSIVAACLVLAFLASYVLASRAPKLVAEGDELLMRGEFVQAASKYSRAVNKNPGNNEWLDKWRVALLQTTPATEGAYEQAYNQYRGLMGRMAENQPGNPEAQLAFLMILEDRIRRFDGGSEQGLLAFESVIDQRINGLEGAITQMSDGPEKQASQMGVSRLRGMRGLAGASRIERTRIEPEEIQRIIADLEAGIEVDPDDWRYPHALTRIHREELSRMIRTGRSLPEEVAAARALVDSSLASLIERFGDVPQVQYLRIVTEGDDRFAAATTRESRTEAIERTREDFRGLLSSLMEADANQLDQDLLGQVSANVRRFTMQDEYDSMLSVFDRAVESSPNNSQLIFLKAEFLQEIRRLDEAMEVYSSIGEMQRPPVSLDGLVLERVKILALNGQVRTMIVKHELESDPQAKSEALAQAKEYLKNLEAQTGIIYEGLVKRRRGEIALLEGNYGQAVSIFSELVDEVGNTDPTIMRPIAQALIQLGNTGEARRIFEDLLAAGQRDIQTLLITSELEIALRNFARAELLLEEVLRVDPGNSRATERLALVKAAVSGDESQIGAVNPVVSALLEGRRQIAAGEISAARSTLVDALQNAPGDERLVRELVGIDLSEGDRDLALSRVEAALLANPDSGQLRAMREGIAVADPLEAALRIVDQSDRDEIEKSLGRFIVYSRFGMPTEAEAAFENAAKINPRDPRLLEIGFERAISRGGQQGIAEAERYATGLIEQSSDEREALVLRGQIELAKGNSNEAERLFNEAVDLVPFDPYARRFLGLAQRANGRIDAAIDSLARAYQGKPDDARIALDYAATLVSAGRGGEALAVLSPSEGHLRFGGEDERIIQLWLTLEAEHGDRERALDVRSRIFENNPLNVANTAVYVDLLMREQRWDDADQTLRLVEELEEFDPLRKTQLRAVWLARQGRVEDGRQLIDSYIASLSETDRTIQAFLMAADFERDAGNLEGAIAWLQEGRKYQTDARAEADRQLGDIFYRTSQQIEQTLSNISAEENPERHRALTQRRDEFLARAIESYKHVLNLGQGEPDEAVVKRLAEAYMRRGELDLAAEQLSGIAETDLEGMLLRAGIAQRRDDIRSARQILDSAVETHPNQPIAFIRRAAVNMEDPTRLLDVVADLDRATKLRPDDLQAWAMLFQVHQMRGEPDAAISTLRQAIDSNPRNTNLKSLAVNVLAQQGRRSEALGMAMEFAREQPDNADWQSRAGFLAYQQGLYRDASGFYRRLYELDPSPENAGDLMNSLLRSTPPPARADINRLLPAVRQAPPSWRLDMLLARAHTFLGQDQEADQLTIKAFAEAARPYREWAAMGDAAPPIPQINQDPQIEVAGWFSTLVSRFDENSDESLRYVQRTEALRPLPPILLLYPIQQQLGAGGNPADLLNQLTAQESVATQTPFSALFYHRLRNQIHYSLGNFQEVVYACRAGLELAPNDPELNNNLAYTLAKHLNDPEGATPYAAVAERVAPQNAAVLDTVGWVYLKVGRLQDADRVLERAINFARTPAERLPALLHRGLVKIELDDRDAAERLLRDARASWDNAPTSVRDLYESELRELEDRLSQR